MTRKMITVTLTDSNFEMKVLKSDQLFVVNFWAEWVGSCHIITPVIEEVGSKFSDKIKVGRLNIDENQKTSAEYGINSVPTILFFKGGEVIKQHTGIISKNDFTKEITALLKSKIESWEGDAK